MVTTAEMDLVFLAFLGLMTLGTAHSRWPTSSAVWAVATLVWFVWLAF